MAIPSDPHLLAFGRIMHHYGLCEVGIKIILCAILRLDLPNALVVLEPCSATDLKNVAKSLAKINLEDTQAESLCSIVGDWSGHNALRNLIAHSTWTDGDRPDSIKPRNLSIREGKAKFVGDGEDEKSYTAPELEAVAAALASINRRNLHFFRDSGLEAIMDAKTEAANAVMSDDSGSDTKQSDK